MSDTRYANLLIDTADRLAEARNGNESWDAIQTVAKRIGATAVNAGGVITLPWLVKPLYGFVTDSYPFLGYRQRSYLAAAGAVACASYLAL